MTRTPVIFVPGLTGSFNLPVLLDWRGPTLSGWGFPPFIDYGKQLVDTFQRAGYTRDKDLFVAFYDWRKAVSDSATNYLKPWIDRAKQRSGASQVILVGHSMGGLVSRSYIQSSAYQNDVARLITLGTPHRGSAEAYYSWGSGETNSRDQTVQTVFKVYLWYLRHAHPFQTDLNPLRTMRGLLPGVRDLLPIDDYLIGPGDPPRPRDEATYVERNLWGDMLNQPAGLDTLFGRVPVTTISGVGFVTIDTITVAPPPTPPGAPPLYPDGKPVSDRTSSEGDGTVLKGSAQLSHPKAENLPPLNVSHGALPDHPAVLTKVLGALGVSAPALGAAPAQGPQLVILTASPVTMEIETPAGAPMAPAGVLGATTDTRPRRSRRIRARDHGHSGKHLNIVVVPNPTAGSYKVRLHGTATGDVAIGAMLISPEGVTVLGGAGDESPAITPTATEIATTHGHMVSGSELYYQVRCEDLGTAPTVSLDIQATAQSALSRLRDAVGAGGGVLGGSPMESVLGGADTGDPLREPAAAALTGDAAASEQVVATLGGGDAAMRDLLCAVAERAVGPGDMALAEAIITQLQALRA